MKSIIICLLVGYAVATTPNTNNAWKSNTEYQYRVHGRTLASLHDVANQYVGVLVRANLRINSRHNGLLNAQITNPEYTQIHVNLPGGWESEIPQEQLHYKTLPLSNKPFEIELVNGVVKQVSVDKNVPNWEANLIKSLVSQIQVDMQGQNLMSSRFNQEPELNENNAHFKTMEDTVTGKCETLYDVFPLPEHVLLNRPHIAPLPDLKGDGELIGIVKTKNYSNCDQIVEAHFGFPETFSVNMNGNAKKLLSRSSISLVVISGNLNRYTIQSSVTTNKIIVSPTLYNSQKAMVVSRFNITLTKVKSSEEEQRKLESTISVGNLVYSYNSPFANDNKVRAGQPNSARKSVRINEIDFNSESSEERRNYEKRERSTRSINSDNWGQDTSSSDSSEQNIDNIYDADDYQPMPTLQYSPENPLLSLFIGNQGRSMKSAINAVHTIMKIVQELADKIQSPTQIPKDQILSRFTLLIDFIRIMDAKELKDMGLQLFEQKQQLNNTKSQLAWIIYRDAITESGTGPALLVIKEWILSKKIGGLEAATIMASLSQNVLHPTEEYVQVFYELSTNVQVRSQKHLNETAILATSDLVRMAFVNYEHEKTRSMKSFRKLSSELKKHEFITKEYLPYLSQKLQEAHQNDDSQQIQIYIRALGNVAHPQILTVFKPYLEGERRLTEFQRLLMVVAMDHLTKTYPKEARSVLYKIYSNTGDSSQVRTAAIFQLMRTQPPASILQRMAEYTHVEPSKHVRSAIHSAIEAVSKLNGPENREFAMNAQSAIKMLKPESYGQQYAHIRLYEYVVKELNLYYKQYMSVMRAEDSIIPNYLYYSMHANEGGLSQKVMSMGAMVSSVRSLLSLVKNNLPIEPPTFTKEQSNNVAQQWVDKIAKLLNIQVDEEIKVEANLLVQHLGHKRFIVLDKHSFEQIPTLLHEAFVTLRTGQQFNYTKLFNDEDITINIPTEMSFPFTFTLRKPTLINIGGQIQIGSNNKVNSEVELLYSSKIESQVGFVTPFDSQMYVAGYDKNIQVHLPISVQFGLNLKNQLLEMKLAPLHPEQNSNILHYSTWPYTSNINLLTVGDSLQQQRHTIHIRNHQETQKVFGLENGIALRSVIQSEQSPAEWRNLNSMTEKYNILSPIVSVWKNWYTDSLHHSILNVEYVHDLSTSRHVSVDMSYRNVKETERNNEQRSSKNVNLAKVRFEDHEIRKTEALNFVRSDLNGAIGKVIDVAVQFGENLPKYTATLSYARSNTENHFHQLLFLSKHARNPYQILATATTKATQLPALNFVKALLADSHLNTDINVKYGENYQHGAEINVKAQLEKSEERRRMVQSSAMAQLCAHQMEQNMHQHPTCANLTVQASLMDRVNIQTKFSGVGDIAKNMTEKLWSTVQHYGHQYFEKNNVNASGSGNAQQIDIRVEFEPENFRSLNITVHTPKSDAVFRNVPIGNTMRSLIAIRPESNPLRNLKALQYQQVESDSSAVLEGSSVVTFNNVTFPVSLGDCYHVFLQTVNSLQRQVQDTDLQYTILVRDAEKSENLKDVKIIFGYEGYRRELEMRPTNDNQKSHSLENQAVEVYLDQNRIKLPTTGAYLVKDSNNRVYARISVHSTGYIKIEFPNDLVVLYDGLVVKVTLHDNYIGQTRGLVGRNNNEPWVDFTSPQNCILKDSRQFAASYAIVDETCKGPAREQQRRASIARCVQRKTMFTNVISNKDAHNHQKKTECHTKHQTRYTVENGGKTICFTTNAIPVCQKGCRHSKNVEKTIEVHCLKRTSTVNLFKQQIDKGASPDFSGKPVTKSIKIKIPITCA